MKHSTDQLSFVLQSSAYGIGVYAAHDIAQGTPLRLFGNSQNVADGTRVMKIEDIPERFRMYCIHLGNGEMCAPEDFGQMPVGWYLNHSGTPNATHNGDFQYRALRDIAAGEEITIDYIVLEEPQELHEPYFKRAG